MAQVVRVTYDATCLSDRGATVYVGTPDSDADSLPPLSDLPPDLASALRRWLGPEPADST